MRPSLLLHFLTVLFSISLLHVAAQVDPEQWKPEMLQQTQKQEQFFRENQSLIWHESFSNGLPEEWTTGNENGFCGFQHTFAGPQGPFSIGLPPLNSQTSNDGFMILDADLCTSQDNSGLLTDAWLQSPMIQLEGNESIMLTFQHSFRYCCSATLIEMVVEVSTDTESWHTFDVRNGIMPNNISANPVFQAIDITEVVGESTQVWVRFRKTGASYYYWMIDDVMLVSFVDNDLEVFDPFVSSEFSKIPSGQFQPIQLGAKIRNIGGLPQTNVNFTISVNQHLVRETFFMPSIDPAQVIEYNLPTLFNPPGLGVYSVKYQVEQDEADMHPDNNLLQWQFEITDTTYSRTSHLQPDTFGVWMDEGYTVGTYFPIHQEAQITAISFIPHAASEEGAMVMGKLYQVNPDETLTLVAVTDSVSFSWITDDENGDENGNEDDDDSGDDDGDDSGDEDGDQDNGEDAPDDKSAIHSVLSRQDSAPFILAFNDSVVLTPAMYVAAIEVPQQELNLTLAVTDPVAPDRVASLKIMEDSIAMLEGILFLDMHFGYNFSDCEPMVHFEVLNSLCGTNSGSIHAIPLNGAGPWTYQWEGFDEEDSSVLEGLLAGMYSVTIADTRGCQSIHEVVVEDEEISLNMELTTALCNTGGSITIIPVNGTEPFTYNWSHDASLNTPEALNLASGDYSVMVTDANDCTVELTMFVPNIDELPVTVSHRNAYCGSQSGQIILEPISGQAPFSFVWDELPDNQSDTADDLPSGTYHFTATDANGCAFSASQSILNSSYQIGSVANLSNASCGFDNGSASIVPSNGQAPFSYSWSTGQTTATIENLAPGTYHVDITDQFGCLGNKTVLVQNNGEMPQIALQVQNTSGCETSDGAFTIQPVSSTASYFYLFLNNPENGDDDGDENGDDDGEEDGDENGDDDGDDGEDNEDNGDDGDDGDDDGDNGDGDDPDSDDTRSNKNNIFSVSNLAAGQYLVSVMNDDGCELIVALNVSDSDAPQISATVEDVKCHGQANGSVSVTLEGATNPEYQWDNAQESTTPAVSGLEAGVYTLQVSDGDCLAVESFEVTEPDAIMAQSTISHIVCANEQMGAVLLSVSGGSSIFSYIWSNGHSGRDLVDVSAGDYSVTITDFNDCVLQQSFTIEGNDSLLVNATVKDANDGEFNGMIVLSIQGGAGNYSISWAHGSQSSVITGLMPGSYTVTVTDDAGCQVTETYTILALNLETFSIGEMVLYPNPATEQITLMWGNATPAAADPVYVEIFNILGSKVLSTHIDFSNSQPQTTIKIDDMPKGIYIFRATVNKKTYQTRFVRH